MVFSSESVLSGNEVNPISSGYGLPVLDDVIRQHSSDREGIFDFFTEGQVADLISITLAQVARFYLSMCGWPLRCRKNLTLMCPGPVQSYVRPVDAQTLME